MISAAPSPQPSDLAKRYQRVRAFTEYLCQPLATEDYVAQSMADVSPSKWHIAHVTWFFETFVLKGLPGYRPHNSICSIPTTTGSASSFLDLSAVC